MDKKAREQLKRDIDFANDYISNMNTYISNMNTNMNAIDIIVKYGISTFGVFMIQVILLKLKEEGFVEDDKRRTRSIQVEFKPMFCFINLYYDFRIIIEKDGSLKITTFKKLIDGVSFEKRTSYIIQETVEGDTGGVVNNFIASFNEWDRKHRGDD